MPTQCSVFIACSLDGFIARPDGDIDWLHKPEYAPQDGDDWGYSAFIERIDALVMGRNSFEKVLSFPEWPYQSTFVAVLSSRPIAIPEALQGKVEAFSGPPAEIVAQLAARDKHRLYIDGGATIQHFFQAGLIDEVILTQIPVILGDGLPLFGSIGTEIALELVSSRSGDNSFVQIHYRVVPTS